MAEGYRELYGSGQEVEVKRATHDGHVWVKMRVVRDEERGVVVRYPREVRDTIVTHADVRKPGEDKR